jgi:hypothetical protein
MTLDEYLDERTERALDHVRAKVNSQTLEAVRAALREQLQTDPVLIELVRRATGKALDHASDDFAPQKKRS